MRTHAMRAGLALLLAALVLQLAGTPALAKDGDFFYNFETLDGWTASGDPGVVSGLGQRRDAVDTNEQVSGALATLKSTYLGMPGPQASWAMTMMDVLPGEHAIQVSWYARNEASCVGCVPLAYVGTAPPTQGAQFKTVTPTLGKGWQPYNYTTKITVVGDYTTVYVALGWQGSNATIALDGVRIKFSPILPVGQGGVLGVESPHPGPRPFILGPNTTQQPANVAGGMRPSDDEQPDGIAGGMRPSNVAGGMRPSDDERPDGVAGAMRPSN